MRTLRTAPTPLKSPVLQLNAYYEPIHITSARHALGLVTQGKATVVVATDKMVYPGIFIPSVIRRTVYKKIPFRMRLASRKNILWRDGHRCQYCGLPFAACDLTLDHVIPKVQGGKRTWENLVAACGPCNRRKAGRTPLEANMPLKRRIIPATVHTSKYVMRTLGRHVPGWEEFLFINSDSDPRFIYSEAA